MLLKGLIDEDIVNYRKTSLYLAFPYCNFKCGKEVCQNLSLATSTDYEISVEDICQRYINNPLSCAIVCGGLEPFNSGFELLSLVDCLRRTHECEDDIVIYSGYTEEELNNPQNAELYAIFNNLKTYSNVIIKFGRYLPDTECRYDDLLGVTLASYNQYARRIS